MDDTMKLPLRLVPRKLGAVLLCGFFLFFFCFSLVWMSMALAAVMSGDMIDEPVPGFRYAFPAFGLPFLLVGCFGVIFAGSKLLPGSPYYHVELSAAGIKARRPWKRQQFAWSELSPFGVSARTRSTKGGKRTTYWVVALRAADGSLLAHETERYKRSVLQIDTGQYVNENAGDAAATLAAWLSELRAQAIEHPGRLRESVAVPPEFRDVARETEPSLRQPSAVATAGKRSSVIER